MAVVKTAAGRTEVAVLPVTSSVPSEPSAAVAIPAATRARLGLQRETCCIVVSEFNVFPWPGPDLRPTESGTGSVVYGQLPGGLLRRVQQAFADWRKVHPVLVIRRTE